MTSASIPRVVFDGSGVDGGHHFELFHDANAETFDTAPLGAADSFRVQLTAFNVDDLKVSRLRCGPQIWRRTHDHLDDGTRDQVGVHLYLAGSLAGHLDGRPMELGPDRIGITDQAVPMAAWGGHNDVISVSVPRARLSPALRADHGPDSVDRSSYRGLVLDALIRRLWDGLAATSADDAPRLAEDIAEAINRILHDERYRPTDTELFAAVERYIEVHLADLDLDSHMLQRVFPCSRATLYRLFQPYGGVHRYIRDQRLVRCFEELSHPTAPSTLVSRVARRWGFTNAAHFHRLFVTTFGLPPSALTRRATFEPAGLQLHPELRDLVARLHAWYHSG